MGSSPQVADTPIGETEISTIQGVLAALMAFAVLMIGQVNPDDRLLLAGLPLNVVLFLIAGIWACSISLPRADRVDSALMLAFLAPLFITLLWSLEPYEGFLKLGNLLISSFLAVLLSSIAVRCLGIRGTLMIWLSVLAALLVAALAFKALFGFVDRNVRFLFLGPIVFARFMGIAAILAAFILVGWQRVVAVVVFSLAVLWTASKGPLIALIVVAAIAGLTLGGRRGRVATAGIAFFAVLAIALAAQWLEQHPVFGRFFVVLSILESGLDEANWGSIGSRFELIVASLAHLTLYPLGVGLGSWAASTGLEWAEYPHNFFMEMLTEGGLLLGSLALIPYFWFVSSRQRALVACCGFLAISQQFSGDLLDSRIWLAFSTLALIHRHGLVDGRGGP